ncbi:hypothetical protein BSIN_0465 [Burkholderia singularis]|uniref:Uncharacterized protein n=1 Tax=Burkholderia singularis TaxID=1503053 RepID=A0A238H6U2_9BURK|nr:hypothetical protein BSIN_0465 [Burkholderia singularis]
MAVGAAAAPSTKTHRASIQENSMPDGSAAGPAVFMAAALPPLLPHAR